MLLRHDIAYLVMFLLPILFVGMRTSLTDLTRMRIENRMIVSGLCYVLAVYGFSFLCKTMVESFSIDSPFWSARFQVLLWGFDRWCLNLMISSLLVFVLWRNKVWGAGDAKLFILYAALIPMGQYSKVYFHYYFSSFWLLVCIFVPAAIFYFFSFIWDYVRMLKKNGIGNFFSVALITCLYSFRATWKKDLLVGGVVLLLLMVFLPYAQKGILSEWVWLILIAGSLVRGPVAQIMESKVGRVSLVLALTCYMGYFLLNGGLSFWSLGRALLLFIVFFLVSKFIDAHAERLINQKTSFAPWMFLGVLLMWFL